MLELLKRATRPLRRQIKNYEYYLRNRSALGISRSDFVRLQKYGINDTDDLEVEFFGRPFRLNSPFWFLHGLQEIFIDEVYKFQTSLQTPRILDCGANIGLSVIYFKRNYPLAQVVAFEPDPDNFSLLKTNLESFRLSDVELLNKAIWVEEGRVLFSVAGSVGSRIERTSTHELSSGEVPSCQLRQYLEKRIDFLKLDIEGAEFEVLNDCRDLLENVDSLFVEYHASHEGDQRLDEMLSWLRSAKFRYYIEDAWVNQRHPFVEKRGGVYEMQLNISAYRV